MLSMYNFYGTECLSALHREIEVPEKYCIFGGYNKYTAARLLHSVALVLLHRGHL